MFQNLQKVNGRIIAYNCPAHILYKARKKADEKMAVDAEILAVKKFHHFASSAKRIAALNRYLHLSVMVRTTVTSLDNAPSKASPCHCYTRTKLASC